MTMTSSVERLRMGDLARLGKVSPPAVTILLPGSRGATPGSRAAALKGSVDAVFHKLLRQGMPPHDIARMVAPVLTIGDDPSLHDDLHMGIALFLDTDTFYFFQVPENTPETVAVGSRFYVRPLLEWLTEPANFLILELLPTHVSLMRCTKGVLSEVPLPRSVPFSMDEMSREEGPAWISKPSGVSKVHAEETNGANPQAGAIRFGIASANEERRGRFFCSLVDRGLHPLLVEEGLPLVLAGSEPLIAAYRNQSTYQETVSRTLDGRLENMQPEQIIRCAQALIRTDQSAQATRHLVSMEEYAPGDRWATSLEEVLNGASQGRVCRLFIANEDSNGAEAAICDEDLINTAAFDTLLHGGEVHLVDPSELPVHASIAALFRYSTADD